MPSPESDNAADAAVQIKKYPNRRYYDATHSRHVTLEEIHRMIRDGRDVKVTDSKTGQDITGKVLAQILIELDPLKLGVFPDEMLHRVIRANEQIVTDFVDKYFNQALSAFLESKNAYEQFLRRSLGLSGEQQAAVSPLEWMKAAIPPLANPWWGAPPPAAESQAAQPDGQPLEEVVEALRRQVADLQQKLQERPPARATRRRRRKRA